MIHDEHREFLKEYLSLAVDRLTFDDLIFRSAGLPPFHWEFEFIIRCGLSRHSYRQCVDIAVLDEAPRYTIKAMAKHFVERAAIDMREKPT